jgi:hypothetical protein
MAVCTTGSVNLGCLRRASSRGLPSENRTAKPPPPACVCAAGTMCIYDVIWRVCALPAIDAIGSRCQPSLRMASACSWQVCLGHILHADGGPGTLTAAAPQSHSQQMGAALQVEPTTCRLGVACDSCTMFSRSAADSRRAASVKSGFMQSTREYWSTEGSSCKPSTPPALCRARIRLDSNGPTAHGAIDIFGPSWA